MDAFIGQIVPFAFNFAPYDWMLCNGAIVPINQYQALYALIGNTYGGDNTRGNFALPDLQGRSMVGIGNGAGLGAIAYGQAAGAEQIALTASTMAAHAHTANLIPNGGNTPLTVALQANSSPGTSTTPVANNCLSASPTGTSFAGRVWSDSAGNAPVNVGALSMAGTGAIGLEITGAPQPAPVSVLNPFLAMNFCICLNGMFPPRQ